MGRRIALLMFLCGSMLGTGLAQQQFVTGYYPVWSIGSTNGGNANAMYPEQMNWQGLTHVVHFGSGPIGTAPFWNPQGNNSFGGPSNDSLNLMYGVDWRGNTNYKFIDSLKKYAHAAGAKLLLSCGGIWGAQATNMNFITSDSSRTQTFVNAFIAFCGRNGYDGVEIDYEPPQSQAAMSLLTRIMKRRMSQVLGANAPLVITVANLAEVNYNLALKDSVAQYLFMMYDMHNPYNGIASSGSIYDVTGFNAPIHLPDAVQYPIVGTASLNFDGTRPAAASQFWGPNKLASMGFPKSKIGVGLPFYGYAFDTKNAPNQSAAGVYAHYLNYVDVLSFLNSGGTKHWDNTAKVPWAGGLATQNIGWVITSGHQTYVTYDDTASVREKVRWAKANGFGGMMIYELWNGWVASAPQGQKDPLLRALVSEVGNSSLPVPTGTFTVTPSSLPVGGGNVTLSWTSSGAVSASINQGVGSVQVNGSVSVAVTTTKTFTLTLTNANGSQSYTATVTVVAPTPTGTLTATPSSLPVGGGNVTLTWTSSGALSASIDQGIGSVAVNGSLAVPVTSSKTFTLTLTNAAGSITKSAPVTVAGSSAQQVNIYSDNALPAPWTNDGSWGGTASDYANTEFIYSGATSLKASNNAWSAMKFRNGTLNLPTLINPSGLDSLKFAIRTSGMPIAMWVKLENASGEFATSVAVTVPTNTWKVVSIPMTTLNPGLASFYSIMFYVNQSANAVFYLDQLGFVGQSSSTVTVPSFVYPANGATGVPSTFTMRWSKSVGATNYHLQLSADSLFSSLTVNDSSLTDTSKAVGSLSGGTKFWRRVRAKGVGGWSGFASPSSFTTITVLPTGTFSIAPDSLPAGGGSVTLSWASTNAQTASFDNGIGSVSLSGSRVVTVGATTTYILTLTNQSGSQQYQKNVVVALPGSQGQQDITSQGTPIALITSPTGAGNHDIEVIRDGFTPPTGGTNVLQQYDTFNGGAPRSLDWIGYQFTSTRRFSGLLYQEGLDNQWGGCFVALQVQVRSGGVWTNVQSVSANPVYAGNNLVNNETYELSFTPVVGDAIRIAGTPTGSAHYIGVAELRAFEQQSGTLPSAPQLVFPSNGITSQPTALGLRWNRVGNVLGYHLQVSVDSLFASTMINDAQLTDTVRQVSGLSSSTKYFWRVNSRGLAGEGAYSTVWRFTTLSGLPGTPVLTTPSNNAINQSLSPTVRWGLSSGAVSYHLQVSRDSVFSTTILNDSSIIKSSRRISGLSSLTKYFWRVRAKNTAGYSAFSSRWNFTTKALSRDVTPTGTPVASVAVPSGKGNPNREVIRDGVTPPLEYTNPLNQFDTFTGSQKQSDWVGYTFPATHRFSNLEFQEGVESDSGGWFASLNVQVRVNNSWVDVQNLTTIPAYVPNNGESFESYELNFDPIVGDGVRIVGTPGGTYTYVSVAELRAMDNDSSLTDVGGTQQVPKKYALDQNYPNPFNPTTRISFLVPEEGYVSLTVYNLLGQKVATLVDGVMHSGRQTVEFSGNNLADGVYMYILKAGNFSDAKKMILLK